jgi:hypothetical protein
MIRVGFTFRSFFQLPVLRLEGYPMQIKSLWNWNRFRQFQLYFVESELSPIKYAEQDDVFTGQNFCLNLILSLSSFNVAHTKHFVLQLMKFKLNYDS